MRPKYRTSIKIIAIPTAKYIQHLRRLVWFANGLNMSPTTPDIAYNTNEKTG